MSSVKYLWAAALLALCVSVFAGAALAATPSWDPTAVSMPSPLNWDENADASITATNNGMVTWDDTYSIQSVTDGVADYDRWGLTSVPVTGTVVTDGTFTWDFSITAPPITTLQYPDITPTTTTISKTVPAEAASFDCNWELTDGSTLYAPIAEAAVAISRFTDVIPGDATTGWALTQIEEDAGRLPRIVAGYSDGTYRPTSTVTRAQMAVYVQRALDLDLPAYTVNFSDVAAGYWADNEIQAVYDATIVLGYGDNTYRPENVVTRDQMAVYIARGMAGGDANVTATPTITFDDVVPESSAGHWAYDYINYCYVNNVVGGYSATTYAPTNNVDRAQMAVFVYRGFVAPVGSTVVLAGPAVTAADPDTAGYDGWTSLAAAGATDAPIAYVGFDAVRLDGLDSVEVKFELRDAATPTTAATGDYTSTVTWDATDIQDKLDAVIASSGNPYAYASWDIPVGSLAAGDYILVVTVNGNEAARQPAFTVQ